MPTLDIAVESWPIAGEFRISRGARTEAVVVTVTLGADGLAGQGECVPYARYGESPQSVVAAIEAIRGALENGLDIAALQQLMPAGAARNAVDCALWDLRARQAGTSLPALLGLPLPGPMLTAYTISLGTPDSMAAATQAARQRPLLKVKLGGDGDDERIAAVRAAAPDATLIVDANEAWDTGNMARNIAACEAARVQLIEQPLPADADHGRAIDSCSIPLCADESLHDSRSIAALPGLYTAVNIKLDKTGGLTDALVLRDAARERGLKIMAGCMVGTSLAMRPATIIAEGADFVDLDAPLLLARDRTPGLRYEGSILMPDYG